MDCDDILSFIFISLSRSRGKKYNTTGEGEIQNAVGNNVWQFLQILVSIADEMGGDLILAGNKVNAPLGGGID